LQQLDEVYDRIHTDEVRAYDQATNAGLDVAANTPAQFAVGDVVEVGAPFLPTTGGSAGLVSVDGPVGLVLDAFEAGLLARAVRLLALVDATVPLQSHLEDMRSRFYEVSTSGTLSEHDAALVRDLLVKCDALRRPAWMRSVGVVTAVRVGEVDIRYQSWTDALKAWSIEDRRLSCRLWRVDPRDGVVKHPYLEHVLLSFSGEDRARKMARELRENGVDPTRSPFHGKAEFDDDDEHALHDDASKAASDTALLRQLEAAYAGYQDCRSDSRASKREDEVDLAFSHYDAVSVRETTLSLAAATSVSPPPCSDVSPDLLKLHASELVATLKEANDAAAKDTAQNRGGADPKFAGTSLIVDMSELDPDGLTASDYTPDLEAGRLLPRSGLHASSGPTMAEVIVTRMLNVLQGAAFYLKAIDHQAKLHQPDAPGKMHLLVGAAGAGKSVVWESFVYWLDKNGLGHTVTGGAPTGKAGIHRCVWKYGLRFCSPLCFLHLIQWRRPANLGRPSRTAPSRLALARCSRITKRWGWPASDVKWRGAG